MLLKCTHFYIFWVLAKRDYTSGYQYKANYDSVDCHNDGISHMPGEKKN